MSADWLQFLGWLQQHLASTQWQLNALGPDRLVQDKLRSIAAESVFAKDLAILVTALEYVPTEPHVLACLGLGGMLADIEWPPGLDQSRTRWLEALDNLLHEMAFWRSGTLANQLHARLATPAHGRWLSIVESTHRVISIPCRVSELPHLAKICNAALASYLEAMSEALAAAPQTSELNDARVTFMYAHARHAECVRAFNQRLGAVLFHDFSPPFARPA